MDPDLLTVELKDLHKEAGAAAEYLASKTKTTVKNHGRSLLLQNVGTKDVKLLLHKFLHHRGLNGYRVVVVHSGLLEIRPPERQTIQHHESKGSPPTAPATMPYYFPGQASFTPSMKKSKKKRDQ